MQTEVCIDKQHALDRRTELRVVGCRDIIIRSDQEDGRVQWLLHYNKPVLKDLVAEAAESGESPVVIPRTGSQDPVQTLLEESAMAKLDDPNTLNQTEDEAPNLPARVMAAPLEPDAEHLAAEAEGNN